MKINEVIHVQNEQSEVWNTINDIVNTVEEENPFMVCDVNDIIQKYRTWKALFPRVKPHYAVKCNDHPTVLKVIAALGLGFDCASSPEIDKVLNLNVEPERIIYAHTCKPPSHIRHAAKVNVNLMTFDNEMELHKIKKLSPYARAVIRIKYDAKSAMVILGTKFGCDHKTEARHLLQVARSLDINVVGVSFHVGSNCGDPSAFHGAIEAARYVFDLASDLGFDFDLLDIGGGFPGEHNDAIKNYAKIINFALDEFFPSNAVKVISEPGTYFVYTAFTLASNIHSAKKVDKYDPITGKSTTRYMYYINDGVFGSINCVVSYQQYKYPKTLKNYPDSNMYHSTIWGPTCDSMDQVLPDIVLPEMELGDWLVFPDMGAYTLCLATPFNGFYPPCVYSIISENNWLLLNNRGPLADKDFIIESESNKHTNIDTYFRKGYHNFSEKNYVRG